MTLTFTRFAARMRRPGAVVTRRVCARHVAFHTVKGQGETVISQHAGLVWQLNSVLDFWYDTPVYNKIEAIINNNLLPYSSKFIVPSEDVRACTGKETLPISCKQHDNRILCGELLQTSASSRHYSFGRRSYGIQPDNIGRNMGYKNI